MVKTYKKPEIVIINYLYEVTFQKKCDFAAQTDGCYPDQLQYK